ncbi:GNAT domain-containing protein [Xylariales sp. AK1849]|nr:GNAT domain-containing protein [Xylariales sp. AK1849]
MGTEAELASLTSPHNIVITTERLHMRPVRPTTDLYVMHTIRRSSNAMKFSTTGVETEKDPFKCHTFERMRIMTAPGSYALAVELKRTEPNHSAQALGFVAVSHPPALGYMFDEPYWGKGYATEALDAFVKRYWEEFPTGLPILTKPEDQNVLMAHVMEGNEASEKVLRKVGFREVRKGIVDLPGRPATKETIFMIKRPDKGVPVPATVTGSIT